jgi:lipoate-protein ligase A
MFPTMTVVDASTLPAYDLDEPLLAEVRASSQIAWRAYAFPRVEVVLGRGSHPERELHEEVCAADRVPVTRRRGGGCAVVLDPGNAVVAVAAPMTGFGDLGRQWDRLTAWLIEALAAVGCPGLTRQGVSDLCVGDRKVGGACLYRTADLLYYATTVLVAPDVALMTRYLAHPPREPAYRRGRAHADFVTTVARSPTDSAAALAADLVAAPAPPDPGR